MCDITVKLYICDTEMGTAFSSLKAPGAGHFGTAGSGQHFPRLPNGTEKILYEIAGEYDSDLINDFTWG